MFDYTCLGVRISYIVLYTRCKDNMKVQGLAI